MFFFTIIIHQKCCITHYFIKTFRIFREKTHFLDYLLTQFTHKIRYLYVSNANIFVNTLISSVEGKNAKFVVNIITHKLRIIYT